MANLIISLLLFDVGEIFFLYFGLRGASLFKKIIYKNSFIILYKYFMTRSSSGI